MPGRRIREIVQLVLEKASLAKLEKDAQESLKKGTDPKRAKKNLSAIEKGFEKIKKSALKLGAALLTVFGIRALVRFTKSMFMLNASLTETGNKFSTVFGEATGQLRKFSDRFASLSGLSRRVSQDFLATTGAILKGMGAAIPVAADLSKQVMTLVGDLTSFHDIPLEETFEALRSGITGEAEPLKRFGIILLESEVNLRALMDTGKKSATELTALEKAVARIELITQKAGDAIGDLARTQDSDANKTRRLAGAWETLRESFAQALFGFGSGRSVLDRLITLVQDLTTWVESNRVTFSQWGEKVLDTIDRVAAAAQWTMDVLDPLGKRIREMTKNILQLEGSEEALMAERLRLAREIQSLVKRSESEALKANLFEGTPKRAAEERHTAIEREIDAYQRLILMIDDLVDARRAAEGPAAPQPKGRTPVRARSALERAGTSFGDPSQTMFSGFLGGFKTSTAIFGYEAGRTLDKMGDQFDEVRNRAIEAADGMRDAFLDAAWSITNAFAVGFEAIVSDMSSLPEAAAGIGLGIVSGLARGMAQYHTAQGVGKLAEGTWPPNPAAIASALKHFAAAGLFEALEAMTARAQANLSGRGASSYGAGASTTDIRSTPQPEAQPPEIHIYIDPFDPNSPLHQRQVKRAMDIATERFGDQVPVNIHRGAR